MDSKKFLTGIIIATVIITIMGGTLAYWNWQTSNAQKTNVTFTVGSNFSCGADGGGNISSSTLAPTDCTNSTYAIQRTVTTSITNNSGDDVYMDMWLNVNSIGTGLSNSENFKYALTTNSSSCTTDVVTQGTFQGKAANDKVNLLSGVTSGSTYYLYIWLDAAETSSSTMNQSVSLSLGGECTNEATTTADGCPIVSVNNSVPNAPVLDSGMIPVKIANDGTVTTVATNDSTWYNYKNKEWANAVLVKESGVKTRTQNKVAGTIINPDDILAYYVWIPRYKYAFPEIPISCLATGESSGESSGEAELYDGPRTIDIVFESGTPAKSNGTAIGTSYYTHPAFTFGTQELSGIWVGKFEMSHNTLSSSTGDNNLGCTTETCTNASGLRVLPNVSSLDFNNVSNMWYATRSMEQSNNVFGLASSDSHMMKNREWGAVAYLSHSNYGINDEIRINNYFNNNTLTTLTGCGADEADAYSATSCDIVYGNASSYPQSTTGNISGIFDMSGGAWEYVMGNYDNTIGDSGFGALPASKYYDVYLASQFTGDDYTNMTFCTLATCGGHALYEKQEWYGDYDSFVISSVPWFIRGGYYGNGQGAGAFSSDDDFGYASGAWSWRGVLVAR